MPQMSKRMEAALAKLEERARAAAGQAAESEDMFALATDAELVQLARKVLNGYVEPEDLDSAEEFAKTMHMAIVLTLAANPTPRASESSVAYAIAQVFLAGILYARLGEPSAKG